MARNYAAEAARQAELRAGVGAKKLARQADEDRAKQQEREQGGIAELKKAIALFDKNYGKGMEAHARADASSAAITSGLGGTTRPGAVSANLSAEFEDMRRGRLAQAQTNLGQFLGSYRDPYGVTPNIVSQGIGQQQQFALEMNQLTSNYGTYVGAGNGGYAPGSGPGQAGGISPTNFNTHDDSVWKPTPTAITGGGGGYGGSNYEPIQ